MLQIEVFPITEVQAINTFLSKLEDGAVESTSIYEDVNGVHHMIITYDKPKHNGFSFNTEISMDGIAKDVIESLLGPKGSKMARTSSRGLTYDNQRARAMNLGFDAEAWNHLEERVDEIAKESTSSSLRILGTTLDMIQRFGKETYDKYDDIRDFYVEANGRALVELVERMRN
ncbi:hypothetical protein D3C81_459940 [compost metagenome]